MTDINIIIPGQSEERRELWHYPPVDDDPEAPSTTQFDFYDGWTVPLDLDIASVDGGNVIVAGEYSTKFRIGDLFTVYYLDEEENEKTIEGAIAEEATFSNGQTTIIIDESLPASAYKIRTWIDCPDLTGPLVNIFSDSKAFTEANFIGAPVSTIITCYSQGDSRVPITTIEREYGENNLNRFERKPLGAISGIPTNGIWILGEDGFFDILLELKKTADDDNAKRGDATSIIENAGGFKEKPGYEHARYVARKRISGGFAIKVLECGSGSKGHYWSEVWKDSGEEDTCGYPVYLPWRPANAEDRLVFNKDRDDESYGIFFIPFDTSDIANFKMTSGPTFDSEEIDGYFVKPGKKYDIFKFPRRWGYYCRTEKVTEDVGTATFQGSEFWPGGLPNSACGQIIYDAMGGDFAKAVFGVPNPCSPYCPVGYEKQARWEVDDGPWHKTFAAGYLDTDAAGYPLYEYLGFSGSANIVGQDFRVGFWWDRWPHRIKLKTGGSASWSLPYPSDNPPPDAQYFSTGETQNDETLEVVQDYDDKALSGHNTIDLMSSPISAGNQSGLPVLYGWDEPVYNENGQLISFIYHRGYCSAAQQSCWTDLKMSQSKDAGNPYYPLREIWEKIAGVVTDPTDINESQDTPMTENTVWLPSVGSSEFWTQYGPSTYLDQSYSMFDNIPYGCSVSPCQEEELVGIIKEHGSDEAVFVWRRTNETVDLEITAKLNEYKGHVASFESSSPEHPLYGNLETVIPNILGENLDCSQNIGDYGISFGSRSVVFVDQFGGGELRKKTEIGRAMLMERNEIPDYEPCKEVWNRGYVGGGQYGEKTCNVTLDVPIVIMFCKERALRWSKYPGADWSQFTVTHEPQEELTESRAGRVAQHSNTDWRNNEKDFIGLGW